MDQAGLRILQFLAETPRALRKKAADRLELDLLLVRELELAPTRFRQRLDPPITRQTSTSRS
jgi:hypothetical protein